MPSIEEIVREESGAMGLGVSMQMHPGASRVEATISGASSETLGVLNARIVARLANSGLPVDAVTLLSDGANVMAFSVGAAEVGQARPSSFQEFITLARGRSVVSGADWGPERFELGLSADAMIRVFWTPAGLHVNLISTTNPGDVPAIVVRFDDDARRLPARIIEARLRALRTLYSMILLLDRDESERLGRALARDPGVDIESLLDAVDYLSVEGFGPGSWYVTLWTGVKENLTAIYKVALMVFSRGREAALGKLEAERRLKDLEADERAFALLTKQIDYGLGLADKVKDPATRQLISSRVESGVADLLGPGASRAEISGGTQRLLGTSKIK